MTTTTPLGHGLSLENFNIVGIGRYIKKAILTRVNGPLLNKTIGKYQHPHIRDEVLFRSPELKLK